MIKDIIFQRDFFRLAYRVFLWHLRCSLGRNVSPLACGCYITTKCNFQCEFCNIWRIRPSFQLPMAEARKLIKELGEMGLVYFSFSGGEPFLVSYLFDLLAYAKEAGILYTHVVSNGYLLDNSKARELADADVSEISFSLDGDEKVHDKNRGVNGAFKKVIEAVDLVKTHAPKTKIVLNAILDPSYPENAIFAVKVAERLRVKIKVQPLNEHPSFGVQDYAVKTRRSLQADEKKKLLEAIDLIQKSAHVVNSKPFLENFKAFMFSPEKLIFAEDDCLFGYHHIEVFANQVFPCLEGLNWEDGVDIALKSIEGILTSDSYHKKLQQLKKCSRCRNNYYICYYEPRLNFPVWNLIKSRLKTPGIRAVVRER